MPSDQYICILDDVTNLRRRFADKRSDSRQKEMRGYIIWIWILRSSSQYWGSWQRKSVLRNCHVIRACLFLTVDEEVSSSRKWCKGRQAWSLDLDETYHGKQCVSDAQSFLRLCFALSLDQRTQSQQNSLFGQFWVLILQQVPSLLTNIISMTKMTHILVLSTKNFRGPNFLWKCMKWARLLEYSVCHAMSPFCSRFCLLYQQIEITNSLQQAYQTKGFLEK